MCDCLHIVFVVFSEWFVCKEQKRVPGYLIFGMAADQLFVVLFIISRHRRYV